MKDKLQRRIERLTRAHKRHSRWQRLVAVQAGVVALCTFGVLMMPAVAMEGEPHCGKDEHVHTDDCYELPGTPAHKEIQCTAGADLGQGEYIVHKHDSFCFDDSGELLCTLAEQDEHVHTDACYDGDSLICGLVTRIVHQHTADCVISVPATDVPTDADQGGNVPGDAVQSTDAANDDTPEDDATVNSTPARAPATSDPIDVAGVDLTITDNVSGSGCYEAAVHGGDEALKGKNVQYQWYKSTDDGATYTAVKAKNFTAGGKTVSNISGGHGENLFLALDGGTVSDTLSSVTYKAVLKVDGTEYDSVWAECTNTTHQASVLNGSFEAPDLTGCWFQQFVPEDTKGLFWKTTALNEEGGQPAYPSSTERENNTQQNDKQHYIEIIDTGTSNNHKAQAAWYHKQDIPTDGKQYAEINAGAAGALYQTIATIPGTTMYWSVDHSGRTGTDTMAVVMMPESKAENITTQVELREVLENQSKYGATVVSNLSAPKGVWTTHSGQYTIPEGQYETRFFFMAVSTHDNNDFVGNHIDNVWFSQQIPPTSSEKPYFVLTKHVVGLTEDDLQQLSEKLTFTVQKSADGSFTDPETVNTYTAASLGSWTRNGDGSLTLSARISMKNQERGNYYKIAESGAELKGFNLTVTDTNDAVLLQSTTVADFTFTNTYTSIVTLPETGGIGTWPFMTAGLLLTGTALALLLKKRKTNN